LTKPILYQGKENNAPALSILRPLHSGFGKQVNEVEAFLEATTENWEH
jgi:hypothetical protein